MDGDMGIYVLKTIGKAIGACIIGAGLLIFGGIKGCQFVREKQNPLVKEGNHEIRVKSGSVFTKLSSHFGRSVDFGRQEVADVVIIGKDTAHSNIRKFEDVKDQPTLAAIDSARVALRTAQMKR